MVFSIKQCQHEGIEIAKAQGKYTGRKPISIDWDKFAKLYDEWKAKKITGRDFMRRMELSVNTFYRRVREYESRHNLAEVRQPWQNLREMLLSHADGEKLKNGSVFEHKKSTPSKMKECCVLCH